MKEKTPIMDVIPLIHFRLSGWSCPAGRVSGVLEGTGVRLGIKGVPVVEILIELNKDENVAVTVEVLIVDCSFLLSFSVPIRVLEKREPRGWHSLFFSVIKFLPFPQDTQRMSVPSDTFDLHLTKKHAYSWHLGQGRLWHVQFLGSMVSLNPSSSQSGCWPFIPALNGESVRNTWGIKRTLGRCLKNKQAEKNLSVFPLRKCSICLDHDPRDRNVNWKSRFQESSLVGIHQNSEY